MQPNVEWINLHFQHQFSQRKNTLSVVKTNRLKVGENILVNRLSVINHQMPMNSTIKFLSKHFLMLKTPLSWQKFKVRYLNQGVLGETLLLYHWVTPTAYQAITESAKLEGSLASKRQV